MVQQTHIGPGGQTGTLVHPSCNWLCELPLAATAALLMLATGCDGCGTTAVCSSSRECQAHERCVEGRCRLACIADEQCAAGERCLLQACLPTGASCSAVDDCLDIEVCIAGTCRLNCRSTADCPAGQTCEQGACMPRTVPQLDAAAGDVVVRDRSGSDVARRDRSLLDGDVWPDATLPGDRARADQTVLLTDSRWSDPGTPPTDSARPDPGAPPADAARNDTWSCATLVCAGVSQCCVDSCAVARGTACAGGYCDGSGSCVECLEEAHCIDSDPCTRDSCQADGSCLRTSARQTIVRTTQWGWDGFCTNGETLGYQRVDAACYNYEPDGIKNSRGFLSFDTSAVGDDATIENVDLTICRTGGPGAYEAELFSASFGLNLTCDAYNSSVELLRKLPNGNGPITVTLVADAAKKNGPTQFQIRYPVTDCGPESWAGKRWRSAGFAGPGDADCEETDIPTLSVDYCTAPY